MVEAELTTTSLETTIATAEGLIKGVITAILRDNVDDLYLLERYSDKVIVDDLQELCKKNFPRISYYHCLEILKDNNIIEELQ
jgi:aspartyl/asparaginyl-tRNA synthetase